MSLIGYMNALTEPYFISIKHGMEYVMQHPHESIMYSRNKINKTEEIPHQCYFKTGDSEIRKTKEYYNFLTHIVMHTMQGISLIDAQ